MSLRCVNQGTSELLQFAAGNADAIATGPYTVAILYRRPFRGNFNSTIWSGVTADSFNFRNQTIYIDDLWTAMVPNEVNANLPQDDKWRWIVISKDDGDAFVRQHWAEYSQGTMTWNHEDNTSGVQPNRRAIANYYFGDPFGLPATGSYAAFAVWERKLSDAEIETTIHVSAADIYNTSPELLLLIPEKTAASPLVDVMGGPGEITRTSGWTPGPDPIGFNFDHTGGTLKTYNTMGDFIEGHPRQFNDGGPIKLGNLFVLNTDTPLDINDCYVVGGRVWTGPLEAGSLTSSEVDVFLYEVPDGDHINPLTQPPVKSVRVPVNPEGWTDGIFDTPWKVTGLRKPWMIAYQFVQNNQEYVANTGFRIAGEQFAVDPTAKLFVSAANEGNTTTGTDWYFGYYQYNSSFNIAGTPPTGYGVDTILGVGDFGGITGPSYSVWNGTTELPATARLWLGGVEVDITTEVAS